jgi:hypothetical protein
MRYVTCISDDARLRCSIIDEKENFVPAATFAASLPAAQDRDHGIPLQSANCDRYQSATAPAAD